MSETTKQPTCEERIDAHKDGRLADFHALSDVARGNAADYSITELETMGLDASSSAGRTDDDALMEQAQERIYEYPLGVTQQTVYRVDISTGGPAEWLEILCDTDDPPAIQTVRFHFSDWFDHAERTLEDDDFEAAADFARSLIPDLQ